MKAINIPPVITRAIELGAVIYLSISGGKDSQAMARATSLYMIQMGYGNQVRCIHAHLGLAEWPQSMGMVKRIAEINNLDIVIVTRKQGDLIAEIEARSIKLSGTGKPFWPSAVNRYCTSDQKRTPSDAHYRQHELVISVEGIRADESYGRGRNTPVELRQYAKIRPSITTRRDKIHKSKTPMEALEKWLTIRGKGHKPPRLALNWYPILNWSLEDAFSACGVSMDDLAQRRELYNDGSEQESLANFPAHPAYVYGNDRLSCAICILGSNNDLRNGATHNPELAKWYLDLEQRTGCTFKNKQSLANILDGITLDGRSASEQLPTSPTPPPSFTVYTDSRPVIAKPVQLTLI